MMGKPCAAGGAASSLEDSDQGMIRRDQESCRCSENLDVLLDLHISFSVWLAAELCCKVQVLGAPAVACIWRGEQRASELQDLCRGDNPREGDWKREGYHWAWCGPSALKLSLYKGQQSL